MKRTILFFSSLLLGFIIYGQKGHQYQIGLELGGYYSPGFTSMKSSSMNADPQLAYSASNYAGSFGGRIGLQYIAKDPAFITFGIAIELGQSPIGMDISKMDLSSGSIGTYSKKLQGNIFQQSWLIQVTPHLGSVGQIPLYFEGGLQFNTVTSMKETNSISNSQFNIIVSGNQLKNGYQPFAKSMLLGTGLEFGFLRIGFRFAFPLDAITKTGYLPIQDGIYNDPILNPNYNTSYSSISGLKMTSIQFTLQIHFLAVAAGRCDLGKKGFQAFPLRFRKSYFWKMSNF